MNKLTTRKFFKLWLLEEQKLYDCVFSGAEDNHDFKMQPQNYCNNAIFLATVLLRGHWESNHYLLTKNYERLSNIFVLTVV